MIRLVTEGIVMIALCDSIPVHFITLRIAQAVITQSLGRARAASHGLCAARRWWSSGRG
jgi:hypothetical protein